MRALLLLSVACSDPSRVEIGDAVLVTVEREPFSISIGGVLQTFGGGEGPYFGPSAAVDRYEVRTHILPGWDGYAANEGEWLIPERVKLEESDGRIIARLIRGDEEIRIEITAEGTRVRLRATADIDAPSPRFVKSGIPFVLPPDEHFFGLGERYASVDHRGLSLYSWAEEAGTGAGEEAERAPDNPYPNGPSMTYFPMPFFLSSAGYGLLADVSHRSEVHLGSERGDVWRIAASTPELSLVVYVNDDPLATLDQLTADTGRPMIPAPWVFGPRRRISPGTMVDGVEEWRLLRSRGVPTTSIDDAVHFLPHNDHVGREAELAAWTSELHAHGFKVMAYNNPYVSESGSSARAEYEHGASNDFFVKDQMGSPGLATFYSGELQNVAAVDFTNPGAVAWYQDLLRRTLALGYDGWMHDFGEYIERDWIAFDGTRGDELHNLYPVMSAKAAHDLLSVERPGDFLIFVRSGWTGTAAFVPAVWGGDPEASFDTTQGIPSALRAGLNLGLSGVPYYGSDISGFKCLTDAPRDKEMYLRWAQLGAVSPIMMEQNACFAPTGSREKWTLWSDEETTQVYARMARLHTRLMPYFTALAKEANETGAPLMRHPFLLHPDDPNVLGIEDAFFLGRALYAAPVVERGSRERSVYLPPGARYLDLDSHRVYASGEATIPAPLGKLPLLLVEGEILPLVDALIETLAPATEPGIVTLEQVGDRLDVLVALGPGGDASFTLSDGTELTAARIAEDAGNPMGVAFDVQQLGDVEMIRVEGRSITLEELRLEASGPERNIRWEIFRLP